MSEIWLTEDGSHTIYLPELRETYHSIHGAVQESRHVYIHHGLQQVVARGLAGTLRIFEVGFGTGLNALLTARFAESRQISMRYASLEAFPLDSSQTAKLNYPAKLKDEASGELYEAIHACPWGLWHRVSGYFELKKINHTIQQYQPTDGLFDLCFYDAFAPSKQAEMWEFNILQKVIAQLDRGGVFVTYCAKGQLKRDLRTLDCVVETLPGPPGKLQMVRATKK
ncbi:MAG: tRNA (5-methylaminomethyl-2-thiouridine)(34)-methyltransferase MnmD [Cyclobacteriaceae bacterium]|nr:tRNA (5-methylaminomethyl-2-thiouridine)(34)-methyltransferase MnmD [Cyclobacteriaceae bacterium]